MNPLSKLVESARIAHIFCLMQEPTTPSPVKPQRRHVASDSSADGVDAPEGAGEGSSPLNSPSGKVGPEPSESSNVSRPPVSPKKFSTSSSSGEFPPAASVKVDVKIKPVAKTRGRSNSAKLPDFKIKPLDLRRRISLRAALTAGLASAFIVGVTFFMLGLNAARNTGEVEKPKVYLEITPEIQGLLDGIFTDLQDRKGQLALEKIGQLRTLAPDFLFASILSANAALIEKDLQTAEDESEASLAGKVAESDAFMVQALVVMSRLKDKAYKSMGNPKAQIETILHKAIAADPLEPDSYILMAAVKRAARESREALDFLQSSRLRQSAASDTMVTEAAINLLELEMMLDADLPPLSDQNEAGILNQFSTAYTAMRLENREVAVSNLTRAKETLPPKVFAQILADPAFSTYSKNPQFAEFFKKQ